MYTPTLFQVYLHLTNLCHFWIQAAIFFRANYWHTARSNQKIASHKMQFVFCLWSEIYSSWHPPFFFGFFTWGQSTALIASSKTVFSPFCVRAEHSRYLVAWISLHIFNPSVYTTGPSFLSFSFSMVSLSSRKSSFVPTKIIGVLGQWWLTSGYHCKTGNK